MKMNKNLAVFKIHDIRAILFDKDGTILDFYNTWRPIWEKILNAVKTQFGLSTDNLEEINTILGVTDTGFTPDSIYVKDDLGTILKTVFSRSSIALEKKEAISQYVNEFIKEMPSEHTKAHVFDGVVDTLKLLKQEGYILGIVTSDLEKLTYQHIEEAGLKGIFDYIACDDGQSKVKPDPDMLNTFCDAFDCLPHEVAMVGDSITDMIFAKENDMGYAIYVRSGYPDIKAEKMADMILEDVNQLIFSK